MINYHVDIVEIKGNRTILLLQNSCMQNTICGMIFFHGNLMEFLTSCLWKFCSIYGILAFSDGNSKFESGSPETSVRSSSHWNIRDVMAKVSEYFDVQIYT